MIRRICVLGTCTLALLVSAKVALAGDPPPVPVFEICAADGTCQANVTCPDLIDFVFNTNGQGGAAGGGGPLDCDCSPPGPYPLGDTLVTISCDINVPAGSFARTVIVRVTDCEDPVFPNCPEVVTIECGTPEPALPTATDNCDSDLSYQAISGIIRDPDCPNGFIIARQVTATDDAGNSATCSQGIHVVDTTPPVVTCSLIGGGPVDGNCQRTLSYSGTVTDCGVETSGIDVSVTTLSPGALGFFTIPAFVAIPGGFSFSGTVVVTHVQCSALLTMTVRATDRCDNAATPCTSVQTVTDTTPPTIVCPAPIIVERGDRICDDTIDNWLLSATATDNCTAPAGITITNDAPACGFPYGQTTTVHWFANDGCGNISSCSSTITVRNAPVTSTDQKGSLLIFSKVSLKWRLTGGAWRLVEDTMIELTNDYPAAVDVQLYFIQGDPSTLAAGGERAHPGCNRADNIIHLTGDEPTWWSTASGQPKGVTPFGALDGGNPPGRPDPDGTADRVQRGYLLAWAVDNQDREIRWNHLTGKATILNYADTLAWEYEPWAFQARCGAHGAQLLDCTSYDANGICCTAQIIPGRLDMDAFQYDRAPGLLLGQFYASGALSLSRRNASGVVTAGVDLDTELVLHPASADLRQETNGPVITKAKFNVWNQNEVQFSNTEYCINCWDQHLLSRLPAATNHFLRNNLQTDAGKYRVDGVAHEPCLAHNAGILGLQATLLSFVGAGKEVAGGNLIGQADENATILYDVLRPGGEAHNNDTPTSAIKNDNGAAPKNGLSGNRK